MKNRKETDFDELYDYCLSNTLLSRSDLFLSVEEIINGIHKHGYDVGYNDGYDDGIDAGRDSKCLDCEYERNIE